MTFYCSRFAESYAVIYAEVRWEKLYDKLLNLQSEDDRDAVSSALKIVTLIQLGKFKKARKELALSETSSRKYKKYLLRMLASGALNCISNCYLVQGNEEESRRSSNKSLIISGFYEELSFWNGIRFRAQHRRLGLPYFEISCRNNGSLLNVGALLMAARVCRPNLTSLLVASAEYYYEVGDMANSLSMWQKVAALMSEGMPQEYYSRLKKAYLGSKGFPSSGKDAESMRGAVDKHVVLEWLHSWKQPSFYFEIGVQKGKSLSCSKCEAIGVDPMPILNVDLADNVSVFEETSDEFFNSHSSELHGKEVDLVFIDGMHLFEYVLRDFINVESVSNKDTLVVIDDIFPCHPDQALRDRKTKVWTGDVWKIYDVIKKYRKDLRVVAVDAFPTGVLCVTNMNPADDTLKKNYQSIVEEYSGCDLVPKEYLEREGAVTGSPDEVFDCLRKNLV